MRRFSPYVSCALLLACSAGPTLYVGRAPEPSDAGLDASPGASDDASNPDDDDVPCAESSECVTLERRPYCSEPLGRCVQCLDDRHCDSDEHCDLEEGDCDDDR